MCCDINKVIDINVWHSLHNIVQESNNLPSIPRPSVRMEISILQPAANKPRKPLVANDLNLTLFFYLQQKQPKDALKNFDLIW